MFGVPKREADGITERILEGRSLKRCCQIPQGAERCWANPFFIAVFRLDGLPFDDKRLDQVVRGLLLNRQTEDPFRRVFAQYASENRFGCPVEGWSIKLEGHKQQVVAQCEMLATTKVACGKTDFRTTGHGLSVEDALYRVYFYWTATAGRSPPHAPVKPADKPNKTPATQPNKTSVEKSGFMSALEKVEAVVDGRGGRLSEQLKYMVMPLLQPLVHCGEPEVERRAQRLLRRIS